MEKFYLSAIVLASLSFSGAEASTILFTDQAAWEEAVSEYTVTTIDFENAYKPDYITVVAGELTFTSPDPLIPISVGDSWWGPYDSGKAMWADFDQGFIINFPENTYGFGFELGDMGGIEGRIPSVSHVTLSNGDSFLEDHYGVLYPGRSFFGFASDTSFSSAIMKTNGFDSFVDNFAYAKRSDPNPVPEPASLLLFGLGAIGVILKRKLG